MRFHSRHPSASYFAKRSQARTLRMLGLLLLVMIGIRVAGRASFWAWMFPAERKPAASRPFERPETLDKDAFKVKLKDEQQLAPGEFIARPDSQTAPQTENGDERAPAAPSIEFEPALLAAVRDNSLNVRRDELAAYYAVLARARDLPAGMMKTAADPDVSFAVLMNQSAQFRGKPITLRGEVRRLTPFRAGENDHGLLDLWEAWLFTDDSGLNPYRVVCTEVPPGIPSGRELKDAVPVRVTGFFFKKEGYASKGGLHTAPLLLARTLRWLPRPSAAEESDSAAGPWIVTLVCLTAGVLVLTCWRISAGDRASQTRSFHRYYEPGAQALEDLKRLEPVEEADLFRGLAEGDENSHLD